MLSHPHTTIVPKPTVKRRAKGKPYRHVQDEELKRAEPASRTAQVAMAARNWDAAHAAIDWYRSQVEAELEARRLIDGQELRVERQEL